LGRGAADVLLSGLFQQGAEELEQLAMDNKQ